MGWNRMIAEDLEGVELRVRGFCHWPIGRELMPGDEKVGLMHGM